MNGLAILLAAASVGVDYGWRPTGDGQLEYIVQIEPALLDALAGGQEIVSEIHPDVRNVRRFRIQVGTKPLPREGASPQPAPDGGSIPAPATPAPQAAEKPAPTDLSSAWPPSPPSTPEPPEGRPLPATSLGTPLPPPPPLLTTPPAVEIQPGGGPAASPQPLWLDHSLQPPKRPEPSAAERPDTSATATAVTDARANPAVPTGPAAGSLLPAATREAVPTDGASPLRMSAQENANSRRQAGPPAEPPQPPANLVSQDPDKPWLPLTLTSLALFASLGGNLYLAWIAWGFYLRHQKLAAQLQAAGSGAA